MAKKRSREPDEALQQTEKHPRLQERENKSNSEPPQNRRKGHEEKPGRPVPSSHAASQAQLPQPPPIQLPSQRPQLDPEWSDSETSTCYSKDATAYDVRRDEEPDVDPPAEDIEYWRSEKAAKFIGSRSGLDGNWVGVRPLGEGGNGIAGLWELRDHDGQTVKQMAVKEESYSEREWLEDRSARDVPPEIKVMSKLNKAKCHAITRLFNYKRYPDVYKHRMYMEFCPHNDLERLIKRYSRFRQFMPEAFLWDTFYHLVEAAVAMRSGTGGWEFEIVHRDLKPSNVFLGAENPKKGFPFYPVAKVGDFGLSVMTNHEHAANPSRLWGGGTEGYMAPEQELANEAKEPQHRHRLSAYTNIWAIGAIMLELLTLYQHAEYMGCSDFRQDDGQIVEIETVRNPDYDKILRDLIRECVEPNPLKRVKLKDLRSRIKSSRNGCREYYYTRASEEGEGERLWAQHRLYYVNNEINDMPSGNWQPQSGDLPRSSHSEGVDPKFPVVYPRFPDGPETELDKGPTLPSKDQKGKGNRLSKPALISDRDDGGSGDGEMAMDLQVSEPPSPDDLARYKAYRSAPTTRAELVGVAHFGASDMDLETDEPPSPDDLARHKAYTSAPTTRAERAGVAHFALQVQAPIAPIAHVLAQAQVAPQVHAQAPIAPMAHVLAQAQVAPQVDAQPPIPPAPLPPAPAPAPATQTALQTVAHAALQQVQAQAPPLPPPQPAPQVQAPVQVPAPAPAPPSPSPPPTPPSPSPPRRLRNGKIRPNTPPPKPPQKGKKRPNPPPPKRLRKGKGKIRKG